MERRAIRSSGQHGSRHGYPMKRGFLHILIYCNAKHARSSIIADTTYLETEELRACN